MPSRSALRKNIDSRLAFRQNPPSLPSLALKAATELNAALASRLRYQLLQNFQGEGLAIRV